jgi:transposase
MLSELTSRQVFLACGSTDLRKWLFANTPRGAKASAAIYSVIETAKENGLNPFQYLKYLFDQLPQLSDPKDPEALEPFLPWSSSLPLHCRIFTK